jgi:hypothetical protein
MKTISVLLFFFWTSFLFGQPKLNKGIYYGWKFPFLRCYLDIKDTSSTIDVFFYKGGRDFAHIPTKTLTIPKDIKKNLILTSNDSSVEVYKHKSHIKVILKGYGNIRMRYTNYTDTVITKNMSNYSRCR